ncbi:DMT family transporter [Pseudovibrio sp. Tun.PSC04-5.I4]|uniref:aromatic amino acid exporter YddG n=1 Tax=Pseudovibrio sp. Tun.PSC04-5.I4 TaxID=1798213 RepID=UPI000889DD0E|nr:DMT family transporter [Pseudovibrio sp. Tun.PSC04-5.I4]SDR27206.1 Permease of the drug/metabolite transporter (DMT) superfamily [Pseudovibrio sp. Tun.PSC04-5.I4]
MRAPNRSTATIIGFTAVLMWALLGPLGALSGDVPPFLLNALCFGISATLAMGRIATTSKGFAVLRQPIRVWVFGTAGVFGYHAFYFIGLRNAPPVEANLLNYLWPVLIVLFSALLPGEKLKWNHLVGVGLGLFGAGLLVAGGGGLSFGGGNTIGYLSALAAALTWSSYSVLSRRLGNVPTEAVAGFCLVTAILSVVFHLVFEETIWPQNTVQWSAIVGMGLLPLGLSFFTWDIGMKFGDIQVLGASAYAAPLLSTGLLILFGFGTLTTTVMLACALIFIGAVIAAKDLLFGRLKPAISTNGE